MALQVEEETAVIAEEASLFRMRPGFLAVGEVAPLDAFVDWRTVAGSVSIPISAIATVRRGRSGNLCRRCGIATRTHNLISVFGRRVWQYVVALFRVFFRVIYGHRVGYQGDRSAVFLKDHEFIKIFLHRFAS
jgi:hypothetical protein